LATTTNVTGPVKIAADADVGARVSFSDGQVGPLPVRVGEVPWSRVDVLR
jgi:hypothetical protein